MVTSLSILMILRISMLYVENKLTVLSRNKRKNFKNLKGIDYRFTFIDPNKTGSKGGNSSVFRISNAQNLSEEYAIKISNTHEEAKGQYNEQRRARFEREIIALIRAKENSLKNIISIVDDGIIKISDKEKKVEYNLRYYIMEKGDNDLNKYILSNIEIDVQEKIQICTHISSSIDQLNGIDIYHRDIKPDNIFNIGGLWKLGDLGLVDYRDQDKNIDEINERIGPFGWHSPEAMNKWLTEDKDAEFKFDCIIDHKSDLYQLGMIFWFIFQGNAPIGQIKLDDFLCDFSNKNTVYEMIQTTLSHAKDDRCQQLDVIIGQLTEIGEKMGIT